MDRIRRNIIIFFIIFLVMVFLGLFVSPKLQGITGNIVSTLMLLLYFLSLILTFILSIRAVRDKDYLFGIIFLLISALVLLLTLYAIFSFI